MNLERNLRLRYDETTKQVHLGVSRQRGSGLGRTRFTVPLDRIPRAQLRELCDALHDYADQLDRNDRENNA
jgi:hypothetical protein